MKLSDKTTIKDIKTYRQYVDDTHARFTFKEQSHKFQNILKSDFYLPKTFFVICFDGCPSKMMKKAFYFILKALFVPKIFKFLS